MEVIARSYVDVLFCLQLAKDLLHPSPIEEKRRNKLKRLVQHPNSYFMDVKCPGLLYSILSLLFHFFQISMTLFTYEAFSLPHL